MPTEEFAPTTEAELARFVAENADAEARRGLFPVGGRTALAGRAGHGVVVTTAGLADVVEYPARDMTITVGAGIRIGDLDERLAAEGQRLPLDVPQSRRATLGGVIATNTSGPRRFGLGTIRDHVIGVTAVDGRGRLFHAGGRVVKNVAGYDLCKMLVGSRGQLAILTTVTLKLRPRPAETGLLWFPAADLGATEAALERLVTSATRPVLIDVLSAGAVETVAGSKRDVVPTDVAALVVGFEGTSAEVAWQLETVSHELQPVLGGSPIPIRGEDADALVGLLTEFQTRSDDALVVKANLRPSRTIAFLERATSERFHVQAHAGNGIVYGHLDDVDADRAAESLAVLRRLAAESGGTVVVHDCDPEWRDHLDLDGPERPDWPLMQRLKTTFDPHRLLNPHHVPKWATVVRG